MTNIDDAVKRLRERTDVMHGGIFPDIRAVLDALDEARRKMKAAGVEQERQTILKAREFLARAKSAEAERDLLRDSEAEAWRVASEQTALERGRAESAQAEAKRHHKAQVAANARADKAEAERDSFKRQAEHFAARGNAAESKLARIAEIADDGTGDGWDNVVAINRILNDKENDRG